MCSTSKLSKPLNHPYCGLSRTRKARLQKERKVTKAPEVIQHIERVQCPLTMATRFELGHASVLAAQRVQAKNLSELHNGGYQHMPGLQSATDRS